MKKRLLIITLITLALITYTAIIQQSPYSRYAWAQTHTFCAFDLPCLLTNLNGIIWVDGTTYPLSATGLTNALNAAGNFGTVVLSGTIQTSTTVTMTRGQNLICYPRGQIVGTTSSVVPILIGTSVSDTSWTLGRIEGCGIYGAGGASDTSVCVQIGVTGQNYSVHGFHLVEDDIANCGNGIVQAGNGDAFGLVFDRLRVHNNACNGIRGDVPNSTSIEASTISNTFIFDNGNGQANCTGIQVSANSDSNWLINSTHFDLNGQGSVAQIECPATGFINVSVTQSHFEHAGVGNDTTEIEALSTGSNRSRIQVAQSDFIQNPLTLNSKPMINVAQADVFVTSSEFSQRGGSSATYIFVIGVGGVGATFNSNGNLFFNANSSANSSIVFVQDSGGYDISGSILSGYNGTTPTNISASATGCHDIIRPLGGPLPTGARICTGTIQVPTQMLQVTASNYTTTSTTLSAAGVVTGLSFSAPLNNGYNWSFHCDLIYSQATAAAADLFGITTSGTAPTTMLVGAEVLTNNAGAQTDGNAIITTNTSTIVVTATPSASGVVGNSGTMFVAHLWGTIEAPNSNPSSTFGVSVATGNAADALTVYRDSFCRVF